MRRVATILEENIQGLLKDFSRTFNYLSRPIPAIFYHVMSVYGIIKSNQIKFNKQQGLKATYRLLRH